MNLVRQSDLHGRQLPLLRVKEERQIRKVEQRRKLRKLTMMILISLEMMMTTTIQRRSKK